MSLVISQGYGTGQAVAGSLIVQGYALSVSDFHYEAQLWNLTTGVITDLGNIGNVLTLDLDDLTVGSAYRLRIRAVDADGNEGPWSYWSNEATPCCVCGDTDPPDALACTYAAAANVSCEYAAVGAVACSYVPQGCN